MSAFLQSLRWSRLSLRSKGLIVVALPVLPLAIFWSLTALTLLNNGQRRNTGFGPSLAVQVNVPRIFSALLDADAGARDHVLTDHPGALARYEAAVKRVPGALTTLDSAIFDPDLREHFLALQTAVAQELALLRRIVYGPSAGGVDLPEREALDRSAANLDQVRALTMKMQVRQTEVSDNRTRGIQFGATVLFWAFLIGSVACSGGGIAAAIMVAGSVSRRVNILAANADRLARGDAIHSEPLGEDELGKLDCRLREASHLLRRREAQLRARTAELEAANHELEAFSYSVSHDLRAPLRAIDGFSALVESDYRDQLDEGGRDALSRVRKAAQRMGKLIDELLNLSQLSRADLTRERLDVSTAAQAIIDELVRHHPERRVEVHIEPGLTAEADPHLVRIALENLLDNAWKYTSKTEHPCIEVGASVNGSAPAFHVRDNGAGFDMKYAARMFDPFQRLHAARDFEGTGIGLAIVQRVVQRHGGKIWAEGAVNAGAAFHFTFQPEAAEDE